MLSIIDVVYSQPADTGTGANINTQLVYAVDNLKVGFLTSRNAGFYIPLSIAYRFLAKWEPHASAGPGDHDEHAFGHELGSL